MLRTVILEGIMRNLTRKCGCVSCSVWCGESASGRGEDKGTLLQAHQHHWLVSMVLYLHSDS